MKKSYWIIVLIVVVLINIIGYFLLPFLHWAIGEEGFYLTPLLLGGALLLISIVLYIIKKAKKLQNNSSAIIFPVSLALIIGAGIHLMRFGTSAKAFDDYLYKYETLYSKFGNKVIDSPLRTTSIALAFDSYGDKLFVLYDWDKKESGEYWEDDLDYHGNCQYNSNGDLEQTRCKHYEVSFRVFVYDEDGICCGSYDDSFEYYKNPNSSIDYNFYSDGAYYSRLFRIIHHRIEEELDVHITGWKVHHDD